MAPKHRLHPEGNPQRDVETCCRAAEKLMATEQPAGYRAALPFLRKAALGNDAWAAYTLGLIYDYGTGVRRNLRSAMAWYSRAVEGGYDSAMLNLGIIYSHLPGARCDLDSAIALYRRAARRGNRNAMYNLGWYYEVGRGVPPSSRQAVPWYRKAAGKGDHEARKKVRAFDKSKTRSVGCAKRIEWLKQKAGKPQAVWVTVRGEDGEETYNGYVVGLSRNLLILHVLCDFHLDGYTILRCKDILKARANDHDRTRDAMRRALGIHERIALPGWLRFESWNDVFGSIRIRKKCVTVEASIFETDHFEIGTIAHVGRRDVTLRTFAATGKWEAEPRTLEFADIRRVTFDCEYERVFYEFMKKR